MGVHVDENLISGKASIYALYAQGCIYHNIGSLLPIDGDRPIFLRLHMYVCVYTYDADHEIENRIIDNEDE